MSASVEKHHGRGAQASPLLSQLSLKIIIILSQDGHFNINIKQ